MKNSCVFRVDGARIWGLSLGHVYRCIALAEAIRTRGNPLPSFLMRDYPDGTEIVRAAGFPVETLPREATTEEECGRVAALSCRTLVFDLPKPETGLFDDAAANGIRTVAIDDRADPTLAADVVVNGNVQVTPETYAAARSAYCGPDYAILGDQFDGRHKTAVRPNLENIVVTFGGSDPAGLTSKVFQALQGEIQGLRCDIVLGPGADPDLLRQLDQTGSSEFIIHRGVPNLCDMMINADLAIAAGGRTAYELAATGTPAIIIPSIEHEEPVATAFDSAGAAIDLGRWSDRTGGDLVQVIQDLVAEPPKRQRMSDAGIHLVDGLGRERVVDILLQGDGAG